MSNEIELTKEERLKIYAREQMYEIGVAASVFNTYIQDRQKAILQHEEFTAQEIFTLFGEDFTQRTIAFTSAVKKALEIYDAEKYPYVPVDLSGILPQE